MYTLHSFNSYLVNILIFFLSKFFTCRVWDLFLLIVSVSLRKPVEAPNLFHFPYKIPIFCIYVYWCTKINSVEVLFYACLPNLLVNLFPCSVPPLHLASAFIYFHRCFSLSLLDLQAPSIFLASFRTQTLDQFHPSLSGTSFLWPVLYSFVSRFYDQSPALLIFLIPMRGPIFRSDTGAFLLQRHIPWNLTQIGVSSVLDPATSLDQIYLLSCTFILEGCSKWVPQRVSFQIFSKICFRSDPFTLFALTNLNYCCIWDVISTLWLALSLYCILFTFQISIGRLFWPGLIIIVSGSKGMKSFLIGCGALIVGCVALSLGIKKKMIIFPIMWDHISECVLIQ